MVIVGTYKHQIKCLYVLSLYILNICAFCDATDTGVGSKEVDNCPATPPGFYCHDGAPTPCPEGYYCHLGAPYKPTACPPGT